MSNPIQINLSVVAAKTLPSAQAQSTVQESAKLSTNPQQQIQTTQAAAIRELSGAHRSPSQRTIQVPARVESKSEPQKSKPKAGRMPKEEDKEAQTNQSGLNLKV